MRPALPVSACRQHTKHQERTMMREQNFLVTYGLHNFVTYTLERGKHVFFIEGKEGLNMINHAKTLIEGSFGKSANIRVA